MLLQRCTTVGATLVVAYAAGDVIDDENPKKGPGATRLTNPVTGTRRAQSGRPQGRSYSRQRGRTVRAQRYDARSARRPTAPKERGPDCQPVCPEESRPLPPPPGTARYTSIVANGGGPRSNFAECCGPDTERGHATTSPSIRPPLPGRHGWPRHAPCGRPL